MTQIIESQQPAEAPPKSEARPAIWGQPPNHKPGPWSHFLDQKAAEAAKRALPEPYDEELEKHRISRAVTAFYKQFPEEMRRSMLTYILGSTLLPTGRLELINALLNDKPSPTLLYCDEEVEADFLPVLLAHRQSLGTYLRSTQKDTIDSHFAVVNAECSKHGKNKSSQGKAAGKQDAEIRRLAELRDAKKKERMTIVNEHLATFFTIRKLQDRLAALETE